MIAKNCLYASSKTSRKGNSFRGVWGSNIKAWVDCSGVRTVRKICKELYLMGDGILKNFAKFIIKMLTRNKHEKYIADVKERAKDIGDITLFTSDCMGGLIYHSLGKKFLSPTINMSIEDGMFLKFCANYEEYFCEDITLIESRSSYPVGVLGKDSVLGGVHIAFEHYKNGAEAIEKWNIRKERVVPEYIYYLC